MSKLTKLADSFTVTCLSVFAEAYEPADKLQAQAWAAEEGSTIVIKYRFWAYDSHASDAGTLIVGDDYLDEARNLARAFAKYAAQSATFEGIDEFMLNLAELPDEEDE